MAGKQGNDGKNDFQFDEIDAILLLFGSDCVMIVSNELVLRT
ncbi:hypothetical protein HMPREF3213_01940 [Heyndrickxia coagulans]|uniref:Uncharacterized protein n=1 Tax=Heyndrickxia coagulans TaxID=1398 RepID=A0A133KPV6_HEYCO|nr:hypothetical protein HMPREF3213_01940 [Heyndrickxia coagulans]